jgi:hypothetical protein
MVPDRQHVLARDICRNDNRGASTQAAGPIDGRGTWQATP